MCPSPLCSRHPKLPLALPGCQHTSWAAARSPGMSNLSLARRWGNRSHGHQRETSPAGRPPCPAVPPDHGMRNPGVTLSRGYSPHFAAGRVCRWLWRGGSPVALRGRALPPSKRSAVRLISVRRFVSVCAPMCVCVWSCLAFSMQVTPSPACSRSPHPHRQAGRQADLPALEPSSPPPARRSRLSRRGAARAPQQNPRHSAKFLSSLISRVLCVCECVRVCAHAHCVFFFLSPFFFFFLSLQPALPDG